MKMSVEFDARTVIQILDRSRRQLPFAASLAVNRTAQTVREELRTEMGRVFKNPTPFTLNSLQISPATKSNVMASISLKDRSYLAPQIFGGSRPMKRSEHWLGSYWVPGLGLKGGANVGSLLNSYGNVNPGMITAILSYTGTHPDLYSRRSDASLKKNKRWRKYAYFIEYRNGRPIGVFQRVGKGDARTILFFIGNPVYQKRFDFFGVGKRIIDRDLIVNFIDALRNAMQTAR
jgi:hypothetical protein